jgi:hypothetical protein
MKKDVRHILGLTKNSVASDELVKRTPFDYREEM